MKRNKFNNKQNLKKDFIWNTIGSTLYAFVSLFFMISVTRINGLDESGIFTFAFSFVCVIQVIGTYAGRAYQVTDRNIKISDYDYIYQRIITCIFMFLAGIIFVLIKDYEFLKVKIILLLLTYRILDAFSEVIYATFQKRGDLYKVGISLFLRSFLGIIFFFIIDYLTHNLVFSIISLIIINIFVLLFYDYNNFKKYSLKKSKFNFLNIKKIFIGGFFVFIFTFLTQYVSNATKYVIDDLMLEKYQTIFGIVLMPATLMSLCSQLIIQPFLVSINSKIANNNYKDFIKLVFKICCSIFVIGIFAELCCYFLGIPVLKLLYGINLIEYLSSLLIIIAGSVLYGMSSVISNALIALRKNKIQTFIYIIVSVFTTVMSYFLVDKFQIFGASLAYFLTMLLILTLYLIVFFIECRRSINEKK